MAWQYIQYEYPVSYNFDKILAWLSADCQCYFGLKEKDTDNWSYFAGSGSHTLGAGLTLTAYSNEADAQTNYLQTTKESDGRVLVVLPNHILAKYVRFYLNDSSTTTVYEFRPSTFLLADEITTGELRITDDFISPPLIRVIKSSVDRIKIGNIRDTVFGIIGYSDDGSRIFELSDSLKTIAGWEITQYTLTSGSGLVGLNSQVTAGPDWRFWAGNAIPSSAPFRVDGSGNLVASAATITGSITAVSGAIGGWSIDGSRIYSGAIELNSQNQRILAGSSNDVIIIDSNDGSNYRLWIGNATSYSAPFRVRQDGKLFATNAEISGTISATLGSIGGWSIDGSSIYTANIIIDSTNQRIRSSNYVSGAFGAGFTLEPNLLEIGNISARGMIRTAVFQKDIISAVGGNVAVTKSADVLRTDMTASDTSTLAIEGTVTFAVNDIIRIKEVSGASVYDEWMRVDGTSDWRTYNVTRDLAGLFAPNDNPTWKKGATVVNYGQSGNGGVFITASETNAPYLSVFTHSGSPWSDITTRMRLGNLNGFLGYSSDLYGIAIGETTKYLKYDPTNGLRIGGAIQAGSMQLGDGATVSGTLTLSLADGQGDCYIAGGTINDGSWWANPGFILGLDDSDSNKAKFFIGEYYDDNYLWYDGTNIRISVKASDAIVINQGGDIILIGSDTNAGKLRFTSTTYGFSVGIDQTNGALIFLTEGINPGSIYFGYDYLLDINRIKHFYVASQYYAGMTTEDPISPFGSNAITAVANSTLDGSACTICTLSSQLGDVHFTPSPNVEAILQVVGSIYGAGNRVIIRLDHALTYSDERKTYYRFLRDGLFEIETEYGNPSIKFIYDGTNKFIMGVDYSDGEIFKISSGGTLGTNDILEIDSNKDLYLVAGSLILPALEYLNFGGVFGSGGYGFRDNDGTMQYKNSGGAWINLSAVGGDGSATDHGSLTGLGDDDHTQYLLASGTRALTGNWDAGSFEIRAQTFQTDVVTGTSPFIVASTTKVSNLNVDAVDDLHAQTLTGSTPISLSTTTYVLASTGITISHSTSAGYIHLPSAGNANQILKNSGSSGTGAWGTVTENSGALAAITTINMSGQLTSTLGTGTAPLVIASTTKVSNLNVDAIDDLHAQTLTASAPISLSASTSVLASAGITISHSTSTGYIHLPSGGTLNQILKNSGSSGTGAWGTVTESSGALAAITTINMSGQLTSTLTTGTSPLVIASTTKVSNLNVDAVDDLHAQTLTATTPISLSTTTYVLASGAITISHSASAGYIHLPSGGSNNQILKNSGSSGTGAWGTVTESSGALALITTISMSGQLTSTLGTGTSPFSVSSTTVNTNLNADLWDGYQFADYLDQAVKQASSPIFATVKLTNLTPGYYPYHAGDGTGLVNGSMYVSGSDLVIGATGDVIFNPTGADVYPNTNYAVDLGLLNKKWLTLHAAELMVETLVAMDTQATIGGRILVGRTTKLYYDLNNTATTFWVEDDIFTIGDVVRLEADGKVEFMRITGGPSGLGPYAWTMARDLDASGANYWYAGDAVFNTGSTGAGFIDLYSGLSVLNDAGPTIVGWIKDGTAYNALVEGWAIGNLNGLYGYSSDTYGSAFGKYSEADYMTIDPTNGIRFFDSGDSLRGQLSSSIWTIGDTSTEHIQITSDSVKFKDGTSVYTRLTDSSLVIGHTASGEYIQIESTNGIRLYGNSVLAFRVDVSGNGYLLKSFSLGDGATSSGKITMSLADGQGDCYISGGTVNDGSWWANPGFILGLDDSDSNKAKFFIGEYYDDNYFWYDGTNVRISVKASEAITINKGGDINLIGDNTNPGKLKFTSTTYGFNIGIDETNGALVFLTDGINPGSVYFGYDMALAVDRIKYFYVAAQYFSGMSTEDPSTPFGSTDICGNPNAAYDGSDCATTTIVAQVGDIHFSPTPNVHCRMDLIASPYGQGNQAIINIEHALAYDDSRYTYYRFKRGGLFEIETDYGDPSVKFIYDGTNKFIMGVDYSDGEIFKISSGGTLGTNDVFVLDGTSIKFISYVDWDEAGIYKQGIELLNTHPDCYLSPRLIFSNTNTGSIFQPFAVAMYAFASTLAVVNTTDDWVTQNSVFIAHADEMSIYGSLRFPGSDKYVNFGITSGETGYGFRDSDGTMQWKNTDGSSWQSFGGYALQFQGGAESIADSTTYFYGNIPIAGSTTGGYRRIYIPKSGWVKGAYLTFRNSGTLSSAQTATVYIRINDTTDYTISSSVTHTSGATYYSNTSIRVQVWAGDYFEIKYVAPVFTTNPTSVYFSGTVFIE